MSDIAKSSVSVGTLVGVMSGGITAGSVAGLFMLNDKTVPIILLIAIGAMVLAFGIYKLVLKIKDSQKSKPFAAMLTKSSTGAPVDPAMKARMDDLRRKFEEGVSIYKSAGKDLYTLPWYLLVGPSGSGKTEALRRSAVGFPQGLQDCLQGAGGTLNMHWWFTNQAVVLDTAGRLFMQEDDREWKEFLRLLKMSRPTCPINGLLLVISSENLLKDASDKIESTAGSIARKLDEMQRILDVRFPVTVIVTKCDKIIGFREFFDTLNDPVMQHQILGWSNPAPLDEAFKADGVDKHLETVRQRLLKRRMGLMQNPIHTSDKFARRIDQVDELFELPDNLVRIAPRLRLYLEKIFAAGEWSPKPLFLRGIYFTSSMREGQALDVSLAQALGVEVESLPGGADEDKNRAYFLRDLFLEKIFKERGLVTRATNVSKQLSRQRLIVTSVVAAMLLVCGLFMVSGYFGYSKSLGEPTAFWKGVEELSDSSGGVASFPLIESDASGKVRYVGREEFNDQDLKDPKNDNEDVTNRAELIAATTATEGISSDKLPMIARPVGWITGSSSSFEEEQLASHRALVEANVLQPALRIVRSKLAVERTWNMEDKRAVSALAELIRLQTYAFKAKPADLIVLEATQKSGKTVKKDESGRDHSINIDALYSYALSGDAEGLAAYENDRDVIVAAVNKAYPVGYFERNPPAEDWAIDDGLRSGALKSFTEALFEFKSFPSSPFVRLQNLAKSMLEFAAKENDLLRTSFVADAEGGAAPKAPATLADYQSFERDWSARFEDLKTQHAMCSEQIRALGDAGRDPIKLANEEGGVIKESIGRAFKVLIDQLPPIVENKEEPEGLSDLRKALDESLVALIGEKGIVPNKSAKLAEDIAKVAPYLVTGTESNQTVSPAYQARFETYLAAAEFVQEAAKPATAGEYRAFAERAEDVKRAFDDAKDEVERHSTWRAERASLESAKLGDGVESNAKPHQKAMRIALRATELARLRLMHEQARLYIEGSPGNLEQAVAAVNAIVSDRKFAAVRQPAIPLTNFSDDSTFSNDWHPAAAQAWLRDWDSVRGLLAVDAKERMMGSEALSGGFRDAENVVKSYVSAYCAYWERQALVEAMPTLISDDWGSIKLPNFGEDINTALREMQRLLLGTEEAGDTDVGALEAVPDNMRKSPSFKDTEQKIRNAFKGLDNEKFDGDATTTFGKWRNLTKNDPRTAAQTLLSEFKRSDKGALQCSSYYRVCELNVAYWNEFVRRLTGSLSIQTAGEVGRAMDRLRKSRRTPLFKSAGIAEGVELTFNDLSGLVNDAKIVAQAAAAAADDGQFDFDCIKDQVTKASLLAMTGRGAISDNQREWARNLATLCEALTSEKVEIVLSNQVLSDNEGETVLKSWNYLTLVEGGVARPRVNMQQVKEEELVIPISAKTSPGRAFEIRYSNDGVDNTKAPTFKLNSAWPLLHEMLVSGKAVSKDGWIEFPVKSETNVTWMRIQIRTTKGVIGLETWPEASQWQ